MKRPGHYCKICGRRRANEKFIGSGHVAYIYKDCARLPIEKRNELQTLTKIERLPFQLNCEQLLWLKKKCKDKRGSVRDTAKWAYEARFPKRQQDEQEASGEVHRTKTYKGEAVIGVYIYFRRILY